MIPLGIQEAACAVVGNCIGANNVPLAKRFFCQIIIVVVCSIFIVFSVLFFLREKIAKLLTDDLEVQLMVNSVLRLTAAMYIPDSFQGYF